MHKGNATRYLNQSFIPRYARRFGVQPRDPLPPLGPIDKALDLRTVLCAKAERTVTNDNTISYASSTYQLLPTNRTVTIAGSQVEVQEWFDGLNSLLPRAGGWAAVQKTAAQTQTTTAYAMSTPEEKADYAL